MFHSNAGHSGARWVHAWPSVVPIETFVGLGQLGREASLFKEGCNIGHLCKEQNCASLHCASVILSIEQCTNAQSTAMVGAIKKTSSSGPVSG